MASSSSPQMLSASREALPNFVVSCTGHQGKVSHTEYIFRVQHRGGCAWTVQRRYQELADVHDRLSSVFRDLPEFPPRPSASSMVGQLFSGSAAAAAVTARERAFQRYFDLLCDRSDVMGTQVIQVALAVTPPEPVCFLKVRGWLPSAIGRGLSAIVEVRAEGQVEGSSGITEGYRVIASMVFDSASPTATEDSREHLGPIADFLVPSLASQTQVKVEWLKPGAEVELQVSAANAVGESPPVAIRVPVPTAESALLMEAATLDARLACASSSSSSSAAAAAAAAGAAGDVVEGARGGGSDQGSPVRGKSPQSPDELADSLAQRREALEREFNERRREAERADLERRAREHAYIQEQKAQLEREREALEHERHLASGRASPSQSFCSPAASPRGSQVGIDLDFGMLNSEDLQARHEELERKAEELRTKEAEREALMEKSIMEQKLAKEALEREREELRQQREEMLRAAEAATKGCEERSLELREQEAHLRKETEDMTASKTSERALVAEEMEKAFEELNLRKAELQEELRLLEESRLAQAGELREAEAEIVRRAEQLSRTENALLIEKRELQRSRQNLAVVQAHVVALLEKAEPGMGRLSSTAEHRLDDDVDAEDGEATASEEPRTKRADTDESFEDAVGEKDSGGSIPRDTSIDGVWSMDWTAGFPDRQPANSPRR